MSASAASGTLVTRALPQSKLATPLKVAAVALAVALTAASAQFTLVLPFTAVPFVVTPLVVLLSAAALGARLGAVSQALYITAGAVGLSVFVPSATLPPGVARLIGPTGGYLMAYPLAAFVTGWLAERGWDRRYLTSFLAMLAGLAVIFVGGVSWLTITTGSFSTALATGFLPFVAADIAKVALAAAILPQAWRFLGSGSRTR